MADPPVVPPKKNELPMKIHSKLDYSEHRRSLPESDRFYDCEEEIDNQQTQNCNIEPPAPTNIPAAEQNMLNSAFTGNTLTQSAGAEEHSDEQKKGNECANLEKSSDEEELSEVFKKLLQFGEEIKACARQCGIDADSFDCITPECTGTEPCLEPFIDSRENPEPTARGDTEGNSEENETPRYPVPFICGLPGEEVWCSASSSPRSINRSETPVSAIDTIRNLRLDSLEEYFRETSSGLVWPKSSEGEKEKKVQPSRSGDKQAHRCVKKSKSDSEVLCSGFQEQKSEDEEGYETDSSSIIEPEREQSSTEWSTLSCHTVSTLSNGSDNDDRSNSVGTATKDEDAYQDDQEVRPDAAGDGGSSHISVHVTEGDLDEGIYDIDVQDHILVAVASGDQDAVENTVTYNLNLLPENDAPPRLTLATEEMLDELFPAARLQPRPVRILQSLPDHPVSENTSGGGEGDYELGRRIVVQSFFVESEAPPHEVTERSSWPSPGLDISRGSLREILRWTTLAGFCASAFLIWQLHHNFR